MFYTKHFVTSPEDKGSTVLVCERCDAIVREGVVARILNRPNFAVYKHKNFSFKVLEDIAKDEATTPDIEEAQEITQE